MSDTTVVHGTGATIAGLDGAGALMIEGGRVLAAGATARLLERAGSVDTPVDGLLVPGLRDAHLHPVPYAAVLHGLSLKRAVDLADLASLVSAAAAATPPDRAVVGSRLDDETLAEGRLPTRHDLDRAAPGRMVLLHRYCGHVAVASTSALDRAGVDAATPDPPGGRFDRDDQGRPTGVLRETAVDVVAGALPRPAAVSAHRLVAAFAGLASLGLTSVGAVAGLGDGPWPENGDEIAALAAVAADLPIKVGVFVIARTEASLQRAADTIAAAGGRLRFLGVKLFADGSLGGHTAAMRLPFSDEAGTGTLRLDETDGRLAAAAVAMGGMVACHAIGDRAVGATLDLFEILVRDGADPARLRIEHASIVTPGDVARMADLGVIASVQPAFLASEAAWLERRVGPDRLPMTYPLRSLQDAGVPLAGGSDCPVEPPHPLWGIAAARDRAGIIPDESLDPRAALALFTTGGAFALGEAPPLAPGSPADFIALDRDPLAATPDEVRACRVLGTWVDGERVDVSAAGEVWVD